MGYKLHFITTKPSRIVIKKSQLAAGEPEFKLDFIVVNGEVSDPNDLFEDVEITVQDEGDGTYLVSAKGTLFNLFENASRKDYLSAADSADSVVTPVFYALIGGAHVTPVSMIFGAMRFDSVEDFCAEDI